MQAVHGRLTSLYWVSLLCAGLLIGCATPSPHWSPGTSRHHSQVFRAASDAPPGGGEPSSPSLQGYNIPGRTPDSQVPWEFFLGNAAHRLIAYMYGVNHPTHQAFYNTKRVTEILEDGEIGDPSRLLAGEHGLCPDITDLSVRHLFEIKPWNARGLQEGRLEVQTYLAALNRGLLRGRRFTGGTDFQGQILIRFAQGQYIWRLEWQTSEPGLTQYRWTRSQQRFESERAAYESNQWVDLTVEELRQYGGWVGQAVDEMVTRREQLATFSGAMGVVIDIVGESARVIFMGALLGRRGSDSGTRQPPSQGGGQVIPFPARPMGTPPAQIPKAAGM